MARRPRVPDGDLYEIATYLARPETKTEIHAELPERHSEKFESEYAAATKAYPLPGSRSSHPYYVWPKGTNKQGRELRIYFSRVSPEPPPIRNLYTDYGKWQARRAQYRINHSNLVMQLFECGFVLGMNTGHEQRITDFMKVRFPVVP